MENASKALLIAASVLIVIILISFGMIMLNSSKDISEDAQGVGSSISDASQSAVSKLETAINKGGTIGTNKQPISTKDLYIGYYADVDGNGSVDGIIYADLAEGSSGKKWTDNNGEYSWSKKTNLNNYYISQESYKHKNFEEKPVIALIDKTEENDRFYVMALTDFNTAGYYWYYNALGKMGLDTSENLGSGKQNTSNMIDIWNENGEEGGYIGATQNDRDVWKHIQGKFSEGWFIPSRGEWSAFANELGITSNNYKNYGLSNHCWSSSQGRKDFVWYANFTNGCMSGSKVDGVTYVRLSTTF